MLYSTLQTPDGQPATTYGYTQQRFEGYKEASVGGSRGGSGYISTYGQTSDWYDVNGQLAGITDSQDPTKNRTFVNDAAGRALYVNQNGQVQRQLIVAGEVLGRVGFEATGAAVADFNFGYRPIDGRYPTASPGVYVVGAGDTLQSIARSAYGDSALWYRLAEANGLGSNNDLKVGQSLTIPNRVDSQSNNASTFKPYDPSAITGSTTPDVPVPQPQGEDDDCGGVGQFIVVIVAAAVVYFTAGAALGAIGTTTAATGGLTGATAVTAVGTGAASWTAGSLIAAGAIGGAAGSIAGQIVGNALGIQNGFSWKQVALGAIGGGISGGLGGIGGQGGVNFTGAAEGATSLGNRIIQGAVGNALTQGVAVVTGLQEHFSWRAVAASAAGAGVGAAVGSALGGVNFGFNDFGNQLVRGTLTGFAAGTTAAVMRGGRISVQQVATDAFGNALGSSLASGSFSGTGQNEAVLQGAGPWSGRDYVNGMDLQSDRYHAPVSNAALQGGNAMWDDAAPPTMAERYAQTYGGQAYDAADKFSMSNVRGRLSSDDNIINAAQMREMNQMQRNMAELNALSAQISTNRQLGNIEELGKAYGAAGYGPGDPYALPGGAAPSADRWIPGGPLPQDGGTVVGKRMSQAEMDAFDSQSGNYNAGSGLKLPGTSGMDEFGRGWSSRGSDWSVLEGDKPLSYSLGSGMRTSLGLVYDGLTGAESFNQAGRAWRAGNYGTAALYGMQGVGTAGLTAMTLGDYALAKAAVTGMAGNTGLRVTEEAAFSTLVPGGGLAAHEAAGGHLLLKHVGQTEPQLLNRLMVEPNISGASSFYNRATAESAVSRALDSKQGEIGTWLGGNKPQLKVEYSLQENVGVTVRRGASRATDASNLRLYLLRDTNMPNGYRIHTGFPQ